MVVGSPHLTIEVTLGRTSHHHPLCEGDTREGGGWGDTGANKMRENLAEAAPKASSQVCPVCATLNLTVPPPSGQLPQGLHFLLVYCLACLTNSYTYSTVQFKSDHMYIILS